ncbi:MAG: ABC transporter substrate-binding protein [Gammaproteobacteria bacterium]
MMKGIVLFSLFLINLAVCAGELNDNKVENNVIRIYQDADLTNHLESSEAIQKGIEVAFDEVENRVAGYKVEFKYLNHRGNVVRSKKNYESFLADPEALAIFSGIHSPPLIKNRTFINENQALTLVPWAAGGPITRYPSTENWVFRLSIDDTQAGPVIVDFALEEKQCRAPHLLLEATPWGDSNLESMLKALSVQGISIPGVTRFGWNIREQGARFLLRKIAASNYDCVILVANAIEGAVITQSMIDLPEEQRLPIISHWGITGGNFHEKITVEKREEIDLSFIQTCFAFTDKNRSDFSGNVFDRLKKISGDSIKEAKDLKSAVGFIHAYDLTKLLIQAINQAGLTGNRHADRNAIRLALENLKQPVQGLVKLYEKPFVEFDLDNNVNGHEALHSDHYCMARYGSQDEIDIIERSQ